MLCALASPRPARAEGEAQVLVLHSYSSGLDWVGNVSRGVADALAATQPAPAIMHEYMNTKRQRLEEISPALRLLYAMRYGVRRPDVIVASDNNAAEFLIKYRDELFPGVPVVYCGVNGRLRNRLAGQRNLTGVPEQVDFVGTLELAIELLPDLRRVAVVADGSPTSMALLDELELVKGTTSKALEFIYLTGLSARELGAALNALPSDSAVLLTTYFRGRNGVLFTDKESGRFVSSRSHVPVFTLWDAVMGTGVMGGHVVGGYEQGLRAGELAAQVLSGTAPAQLPVTVRGTHRHVLDQMVLDRFHVPEERLPQEFELLHRRPGLLGEHQEIILGLAACAISLAAIAAALVGIIFYRRRSERRVRASENLYRGLFETSRDGIAVADADGVVEAMNPSLERMLAMRPGEGAGLNILDVLGDGDEVRELLSTIAQRGYSDELFVDFMREDGTVFPATARGWRAADRAGSRLHVHVRDITEHRRTEELLLESERQLRTILDYVHDWEYWVGTDGELIYTSPACERITGYAPEAFMADGQLLLRICHPDDRDVLTRHLDNGVDDEEGELEFRIIARSGEERWIGHVCRPVYDMHGAFNGRRASNRDITAHKHVERALAKSEERLRLALMTAQEGVWDLDLATGELYLGPRVYTLLGFEPDEFPPSFDAVMELVHPEDRDALRDALDGCGKGWEQQFEIDCRVRARQGEWNWVQLRGRVAPTGGAPSCPLPTASVSAGSSAENADMPLRIVGTLVDMRERRAMEEQLLSAGMQAEQASMAKSEFLANMSHEIRTPVSGILGVAEMMARELEDGAGMRADATARREHVEMINASARSLLRIIDDILDLSRIEAGHLELLREPFCLPSLLDRLHDEFRHRAENTGLGLVVEARDAGGAAAEQAGVFLGDEERLLQVLRNLVGNAFKYTESGWIKVESQVREAAQGGFEVEISVRDTGIGMPSEQTDVIFDSFKRLDSTHVRRRPGAGLGLAICRQLVLCMGGTIRVTSSVGKGTTFTVALPLGQADPEQRAAAVCATGTERTEPAETESPEPGPDGTEGPDGTGGTQDSPAVDSAGGPAADAPGEAGEDGRDGNALRILLAEDNAVNLMFIKHFLERNGHAVTAVMNGVQALEALAESRFDLVLMDVQMPEMDGLETTREIRAGAVENCPRDLPVIALTAYAMKGDRESFMEAGMNGYVSKPVNIDELMEAIRAAVGA